VGFWWAGKNVPRQQWSLLWSHPHPLSNNNKPKGYKEVTDPQSEFYARRIYGRIHVRIEGVWG